MVFINEQQKPTLEELAHYGVKGMHWGVRKARTGDIQVTTNVLDRVASGNGSVRDKTFAAITARPKNLIKGRGIKGEAANRSAELKAHANRLATGKATAKDVLRAYGNASLISIVRSLKD